MHSLRHSCSVQYFISLIFHLSGADVNFAIPVTNFSKICWQNTTLIHLLISVLHIRVSCVLSVISHLSYLLPFSFYYLRWRRRLGFWFGLSANLWTDFDKIFCRGRAWLKDQVIQFWWRSRSHFGSGSPKSEIRILRIAMAEVCALWVLLVFFIPYLSLTMKNRHTPFPG